MEDVRRDKSDLTLVGCSSITRRGGVERDLCEGRKGTKVSKTRRIRASLQNSRLTFDEQLSEFSDDLRRR